MHYKLHCEVTKEAIDNFTRVMIQFYEDIKDNIDELEEKYNNELKQKNIKETK
ncbi:MULTISPECIES: hypothetical protein [Clostridium]|jgi:hypothetical protein|uniref:hypothetical protein n=1 Tax=Clostridium TaxID=1485 RepID=UPI00136C9443|nr:MULTISPECIES: hypothetical protein [Clostridium]MDB2150565.1 hypothetical protein [Clostridium butyricum]MDU1602483.1 hypothetical protein [Clostridium sp.]MDU4587005.1 hypothetical protein [Clostridium sp.]MZI79418.1 hypothetical protein [Clostridium butyricum]